MKKIVTFGEVMIRLSPSDFGKLQHGQMLSFHFGGTEMNVGASLAQFGMEVHHVTNVSDDFVGRAAMAAMRSYGIAVGGVNKIGHPLGLYFMETGASLRPSTISYNRLYGAFSYIEPEMVDWDKILQGADYFHWTGICPAISEGAYQTLRLGLERAKSKNIRITVDPTYRSNLWKYGRNSREVLSELVSFCNIFIGGLDEINEILDANFNNDRNGFVRASKKLIENFPSIEKVFEKVRYQGDSSQQVISSRAWSGSRYIESSTTQITHVVDRVGAGDAFAAGIIYGLENFEDEQTLAFANAASALKHTIPGDVNLASVEEIMEVVAGKHLGRIKR